MIRDTFFSLPRFVHLCRKEMAEDWKKHALRIVLMYGMMTFAFLWSGFSEANGDLYTYLNSQDPSWKFVATGGIILCVVFGCISASFMMGQMKSKTGRTSVLMTPVTPFEYYFSRWIVYVFAYLLVFLIVFKLADYTRVSVISLIAPEDMVVESFRFSYMKGNHSSFFSYREFIVAIAGYFFAQSWFVLGSSIWPKNAFLKTFSAGAVFVFTILLTARIIRVSASSGPSYFSGHNMIEYVLVGGMSVFVVFNWILAYYRFKESEIINRF